MNRPSNENHEPYTGYTDTPDDHLVEGFDPDVALDLGIPIDDETLESHRQSAERVRDVLAEHAIPRGVLPDGQAEHDAVVEQEGLVTCANCNKPGCRGCGRS